MARHKDNGPRIVGPTPPRFDSPPPCAQVGVEVFFAESREAQKQAAGVCMGCPFRRPCGEYALRNEHYGVWGGYTERYRQEWRRAHGVTLAKHIWQPRQTAQKAA